MRIEVEFYRHLSPVIPSPSVLPLDSQILPGHNQETYQRLQTALEATPPHALWIAVCDDLPLQRQLAITLEDRLRQQVGAIAPTQLIFDVTVPNLGQQMQMWAAQTDHPPLLQVLGIEQLTHQSSDHQYQFVRSLRSLVGQWSSLNCSLLLWMPRPWLKQVRRVAPDLCQAVFEFMGDPTPLPTATGEQAPPPTPLPIRQWQHLGRPAPEPPSIRQDLPEALTHWPESTAVPAMPGEAQTAESDGSSVPDDLPTFSEALWNSLQADLDRLERREMELLPPPADSVDAESLGELTTDLPLTEVMAQAGSPWAEAEPSDWSVPLQRDPWLIAYELRDRVQAGDHSAATVQATIQQYERLQAEDAATPRRTETLNDLGSLYWLWAQQAAETDTYQQRLARSCTLYEAASAPISPGTSADVLSRLHSNLGSVYSLLAAHQDPLPYLGKAVKSFHRALQYTPVETAPVDYATLQTHLGTAYWSLAQHTQEATHLHRAIAAYQEALRQAPPQRMPQTYAQLQNNLGIALWSLARHERPIFLLEQAIAAYKSALAHRTLESDPVSCAATHNNLATAYWDLGGHYPEQSADQKQTWQQAITAYETALMIAAQVNSEAMAFDVWATHHSVGVVYDQLAIALAPHTEAQQTLLSRALNHYVQALIGWQSTDTAATETVMQAIVRNLQLQTRYLGIDAQQRSLSQIPADWLPKIWRQL